MHPQGACRGNKRRKRDGSEKQRYCGTIGDAGVLRSMAAAAEGARAEGLVALHTGWILPPAATAERDPWTVEDALVVHASCSDPSALGGGRACTLMAAVDALTGALIPDDSASPRRTLKSCEPLSGATTIANDAAANSTLPRRVKFGVPISLPSLPSSLIAWINGPEHADGPPFPPGVTVAVRITEVRYHALAFVPSVIKSTSSRSPMISLHSTQLINLPTGNRRRTVARGPRCIAL